MSDERGQFGSARVVVLSPDDAREGSHLWSELSDSFECVPISTHYEAAAEVLSGGVVALVIDLSLMSPRHGSLLDIARHGKVRVFGFGAIPAGLSSEDLRGVWLVDRAGLLGELYRAMAAHDDADETLVPFDADRWLGEPAAGNQPPQSAEVDAPPPPPRARAPCGRG